LGEEYISEEGYCLLIAILSAYDTQNHLLQHFLRKRYQYRELIYESQVLPNDERLMDEMKDEYPEEFLCPMCGLEDIKQNYSLLCDCRQMTHMKCPCYPQLEKTVPSGLLDHSKKVTLDDYLLAWFCPICREYTHNDINLLTQRRHTSLAYHNEAIANANKKNVIRLILKSNEWWIILKRPINT